MTESGQPRVPVKMTPLSDSVPRRRTLAFVLVLGLCCPPAWAEDGGVSDAPVVTILPGDKYVFNKAAFDVTNAEMKRLQALEREHKGEQWLPVLLIGAAVGLVVGAGTVGALWAVSSAGSAK